MFSRRVEITKCVVENTTKRLLSRLSYSPSLQTSTSFTKAVVSLSPQVPVAPHGVQRRRPRGAPRRGPARRLPRPAARRPRRFIIRRGYVSGVSAPRLALTTARAFPRSTGASGVRGAGPAAGRSGERADEVQQRRVVRVLRQTTRETGRRAAQSVTDGGKTDKAPRRATTRRRFPCPFLASVSVRHTQRGEIFSSCEWSYMSRRAPARRLRRGTAARIASSPNIAPAAHASTVVVPRGAKLGARYHT